MSDVTYSIYGASDDLVYVDGPEGDEWGSYDHPSWIVCSPGDRFKVEYDDSGIWRVTHEHVSGDLTVQIARCDGDDEDVYSDVATVTGEIEWVDCFASWPVGEDALRHRLRELLDDRHRCISTDTLLRMYHLACGRKP